MTGGFEGFDKGNKQISKDDINKLLQNIENINFGSVTLIIQQGKIVQIEKNEKIRLK